MNIVAIIERMEAQGMDPAAIVTAVKCIAAEQDDIVERRRANDRERQARHRAKADSNVTERDNDVTECDGDGQKEKVSHTLPKEKINISTRARAKSDLPEDWEPDAKTWHLADELGFTAQEAWDQLERMRDWAKNADGGKGRKADWNAAFRNWLKRASDDRSKQPQARIQRNSTANALAAIDLAADEAIRRAGGHGAEGSEEDFDLLPGLRKSAA